MYKHTQNAWWMLILIGLTVLVMLFSSIGKQGFATPDLSFIIFASAILIICAISFCGLTVIVDNNFVRVKFGLGLLRKSFKLASIKSCELVRNKWWYGWGIHWTPEGLLYNIYGLDAVRLVTNDGKKYRIGTDEPQKLHAAIRQVFATIDNQC